MNTVTLAAVTSSLAKEREVAAKYAKLQRQGYTAGPNREKKVGYDQAN